MVNEYSEKDYDEVSGWYKARSLPVPGVNAFPTFGLVVHGVAAGFLIVTDCNLALIDFYISNPDVTREERDVALDAITEGLLEYGIKIGITNFKADTQVKRIRQRAENYGFKYIGEFSNLFLRAGD
jgi:hypothetical protein